MRYKAAVSETLLRNPAASKFPLAAMHAASLRNKTQIKGAHAVRQCLSMRKATWKSREGALHGAVTFSSGISWPPNLSTPDALVDYVIKAFQILKKCCTETSK